MNYRHAFHAGNFADVFKHVLLVRMLDYLRRKPAPFFFLDTHAGIAEYDLAAPQSTRTGEWREGIGRLAGHAEGAAGALLKPYLDLVGPCESDGRPYRYPGSPRLAQAMLRDIDRASLCELHRQDAALLRAAMGRDRRVKVIEIDGYLAWNAFLPPKERRGLVLVDPPFEKARESQRMQAGLVSAQRKWATGTQALWYPIKSPSPGFGLAERLRAAGLRRLLHLRLWTGRSEGLHGCGMIVLNPPYSLREEAEIILPYLTARLAQGDGADCAVEWLAGE